MKYIARAAALVCVALSSISALAGWAAGDLDQFLGGGSQVAAVVVGIYAGIEHMGQK